MTRYLAAYGVCILVMLVLDVLWIGGLARGWYQQGIGHLMADRFNGLAAAAFYAVYGVGLVYFVVLPDGTSAHWSKTIVSAALFGFCAYATYDLTNAATLKQWPWSVSLMDMAWGSFASVCACLAAKSAVDHLGG